MTSEDNRFSRRVWRYGQVGANIGGVAARLASARLIGGGDRAANAAALARALGTLKGPLMKVAQMMATIPDAVPAEYAAELARLQSGAPPMGWPFVRRRMAAELGPDWQSRFAEFGHAAAAAASLGQVHRARALDGAPLACKLQYPDMDSAVEADLNQLRVIFAIHKRMDPAILTDEIAVEIGARLREELDYLREARHLRLYRAILAATPEVRVPVPDPALTTRRLLTMSWEEGRPLLDYRDAGLDQRNLIGAALFRAWWNPFASVGVIHGDPHLGNYTIRADDGRVAGINLLDFGCIRIFPARFVKGVVDLYEGLRDGRDDQIVHAYETWGFTGLGRPTIAALNIWANFIYGPLLDDRVRSVAGGVDPGAYGRKEAFTVHKALRETGPVKIPREFVFMDRAAIGLGAVFLHLGAEMNFHRLFEAAIADFDEAKVAARQARALGDAGIEPSD
jgi:predicted unusual protein kinase regulating ubiquinone biosynthesis (AarF/ABC1/UbiB family)